MTSGSLNAVLSELVHCSPSFYEARYFSLARYALFAALETLNLKKGSRVLVPEFICRDLLASIHTAKLVPVFYAVNENLSPSDSIISWPDSSVVIAVNYFGFPQDLAKFTNYCSLTGSYLIEDNAHGFTSRDLNGVPLGTRGDFGLLSIRKTFLIPNGAILLLNHPGLLNSLPDQIPFLSNHLEFRFRIKSLLLWLQRSTGIQTIVWFKDFVRIIRFLLTGYLITPLPPESEYILPHGNRPHEYMLTSLSEELICSEKFRRRTLYNTFERVLVFESFRPVFSDLPQHTVPYGFPFYSSQTPHKAIECARNFGLDCVKWPDLPKSVAAFAPHHYCSMWIVIF